MRVEVRFYATLAVFLPRGAEGGAAHVEVPDGSTLADLGRALGIPDEWARVALVNGRDAEPGQTLWPGDLVDLFPPLAGGG